MEQNTEEWRIARCGSLGASQITDAISKGKDGKFGSTSQAIKMHLVVERLTQTPIETYKSPAMIHGSMNEEAARFAYEALTGDPITECGLFKHPTIEGTHASPDGLVHDVGLVEIKCPNSTTHVEYMRTEKVPTKYMNQMQWQMRCTEREWCDFLSFDPRMPESLQLWIKRVERNDKEILRLETEIRVFLDGVKSDVIMLNNMGGMNAEKMAYAQKAAKDAAA